jgi:hypothetical protein
MLSLTGGLGIVKLASNNGLPKFEPQGSLFKSLGSIAPQDPADLTF